MQDIIRIPHQNKEIKMSFIEKIIYFIKYHNAFIIGLVGIFVVMSSVLAASPQVREAMIGKAIIGRQGIDNSAILIADLDNFDFEMKIKDVFEDEESYHLKYSYKTMGIEQNIWKEIEKEGMLNVVKVAIEGEDLGLYVAEELGEIVDSQLAYLKEVQEKESQKGKTLVQETTKYTALIGLVLDSKTKVLPGYEPVVKPVECQTSGLEIDNNQPYDDDFLYGDNYYEDLTRQVMEISDNNEIDIKVYADFSGEARILASEKQVKIYNQNLKLNSKIFLDLDNEYHWFIREKHAIPGDNPENNYFVVALSDPAIQDISFGYGIVRATVDPGQDMIGSGVISEAGIEAKIYNPNLKKSSKIFVSFTSNIGSRSWYIGDKSVIPGDDPANHYFTVRLSSPATHDISFDYWIVQTAISDQRGDSSPTVQNDNSSHPKEAEGSQQGTGTTTPNVATSTPEIVTEQETAMTTESTEQATSTNATTTDNLQPTTDNLESDASTTPDLIDQAIDIIEKGKKDQEIVDSIKEGLGEDIEDESRITNHELGEDIEILEEIEKLNFENVTTSE